MHIPAFKLSLLFLITLNISACATLFGPPEQKCAYPARIIDKVTLYNQYYDNDYSPFRLFGWIGGSNIGFGTSFTFEETLASHNLLPRYRYLVQQENGKKLEIALPPTADWPIGQCVNVLVGKRTKKVTLVSATNCHPKFTPSKSQ